MISLSQYDNYVEVIVLRSPEELNLNMKFIKSLFCDVKLLYNPEERFLRVKISNSVSNENFAILLKDILNKEGYFSNDTKRSYYNSVKRWESYRH